MKDAKKVIVTCIKRGMVEGCGLPQLGQSHYLEK